MADDINGGIIVGLVSFDDGDEAGVSVQAVNDYIADNGGGLLGDGVLEVTNIGGGLVRLDAHLERIDGGSIFAFVEGTNIPIALGNVMDGLRADVPYYVLFTRDENGVPTSGPTDVELWSCDADALRTDKPDDWEIGSVQLLLGNGTPATADNHELIETLEDGTEVSHTLAEFGLDPTKLVTFRNEATHKDLTLGDMLRGLLILRASFGVALQMKERREAQEGSGYARRKRSNVREKHIDLVNGTLTNAIFERGPASIGPAAYFSDDPVTVKSGNGGHVLVTVATGDDTDIDAPVGEYQPSDRTRFWLDPLYTLAYSGHDEITGSDILKLNGFTNPYSATAQEVIRDALEHITKAMGTLVSIDVTNEKRNKRRGNATVSGSVRLKPIVSAELDLDTLTTDDGEIVRDFTVRLVHRGTDVGEALPIAQYDRSRGMFTQVSTEDVTFKDLRLGIDDRQMWRYVLRRIKARKQSDTILFETMWRDLELPEPNVSEYRDTGRRSDDSTADLELADERTIERRRRDAIRKKHERMTTTLYKMLDQKEGVLFESYQRKRTKAGVVGVIIHPLREEAREKC